MLKPDGPAARLAYGIGRRARQDWHSQQTRADNAQAEQRERLIAGNRPERLTSCGVGFTRSNPIFPWIGKPGYNLITDEADNAIDHIKQLNAAAP